MKIGIITYHFARNYGAVLQCYALQRYLKEKGNEVIVINYTDKNQERNNSLFNKRTGLKNILFNICLFPFIGKRIKKEQRFKDFISRNLNCSKRVENIKELEQYINEAKFDLIISGSDQVWNPKIKDFTPAFFLPIETNCKKATYAASAGRSTKEDLEKFKKEINDFDFISLREKETVNFIEELSNKNIYVSSDPVTLLDKNEWEKIANILPNKNKKYLLCYFIHDYFNEEYKIAKQIAKQNNLKLIIINAKFSAKSFYINCLKDIGPMEFLSLFKNASYICTDSFHGTIFSLIFRKDFISFSSKLEKQDSRKQNILKEVGLLERLKYIEDKDAMKLKTIDYKNFDKKLKKIIKESEEYLEIIQND